MISIFLAMAVFCQEPNPQVDLIQTVRLVNIPIRVYRDGKFFSQLSESDFEVRLDGKKASILAFNKVNLPVTVHFLFDLSASNSRNLFLMKEQAVEVLRQMRSADRAKISYFSRNYKPLTGYTNDFSQLIRLVEDLTPQGTTALYDGIAKALIELNKGNGDRYLLVFCDGYDLASKISEKRLLQLVEATKLPIFVVSYNESRMEHSLLAAQTQYLHALVLASKGILFKNNEWESQPLALHLANLKEAFQLSVSPSFDYSTTLPVTIASPTCPECTLVYPGRIIE